MWLREWREEAQRYRTERRKSHTGNLIVIIKKSSLSLSIPLSPSFSLSLSLSLSLHIKTIIQSIFRTLSLKTLHNHMLFFPATLSSRGRERSNAWRVFKAGAPARWSQEGVRESYCVQRAIGISLIFGTMNLLCDIFPVLWVSWQGRQLFLISFRLKFFYLLLSLSFILRSCHVNPFSFLHPSAWNMTSILHALRRSLKLSATTWRRKRIAWSAKIKNFDLKTRNFEIRLSILRLSLLRRVRHSCTGKIQAGWWRWRTMTRRETLKFAAWRRRLSGASMIYKCHKHNTRKKWTFIHDNLPTMMLVCCHIHERG